MSSPAPYTAPLQSKEPAAPHAVFQHSCSPRAAAAATSAANIFLKEIKLEWKHGNSHATWPLQCLICQDSGIVGCEDFRNCDLFDGFALFLWGKPIGLQELLISSSPCPKLSSQKAYCQTSCKSIIKNGLPKPSLFTKWKTICLFLFVCYAIL